MDHKLIRVAQVSINDENFYACPYCKWVFWGEEYMTRHMKKCICSPEAAGCSTCGHRKKDDVGYYRCDDRMLSGPILDEKGNSMVSCSHYEEANENDGTIWMLRLDIGVEFTPRNFNKGYRVIEGEDGE